MPKTMVLYHGGGCMDGFGAAWASSRYHGRGDDVAYIPMNYGDPLPPELESGSVINLYMLDFSVPRETLVRLAAGPIGWIVVLDHHKSAEAELAGLGCGERDNLKVIFDMEKSGAVLAWEYFRRDEPVADMLRYVQDRDLWRWALPDSKAMNAALSSHPRDFPTWDWLAESVASPVGRSALISDGNAILRSQAAQVEGLASKAHMASIDGHIVPMVNTPLYQSEVGERLCQLHPGSPFAATFFVRDHPEKPIVVSLRSRGEFDVSEVARKLGGGGHRNAAGFTTRGQFP